MEHSIVRSSLTAGAQCVGGSGMQDRSRLRRSGSVMLGASVVLALHVAAIVPAVAAAGPRPVTLEEALRAALENSPDLAAATARIAAARGAIVQAQSAFFPTLKVEESYTATNDPVQAFMMTLKQRAFDLTTADFNHPGTVDNVGTRLVGRWPLYNGGRDAAARTAATLGADAAQDEFAAARNTLVFEVTRAFYETLKAKRFVASAGAQVTDLQSSRQLAASRRAEGAALETDVLDADVRLSLAREELVRAQSTVAVAEAVLSGVAGLAATDAITAAEPAAGSDAVPEAAAPDGSHERPEISAARKAVARADEDIRAARGNRLPRVNAFAGYDVDSGDLADFSDSWTAGVSVELDVFDGGRTTGAIASAVAARNSAAAELRRVEIAVDVELRRAQLQVEESDARLATSATASQQAERSLALTRERYRQGLALFTQVLDAETSLTAARQRRDAAFFDRHIAVAALDKARGNNWTPVAEQPGMPRAGMLRAPAMGNAPRKVNK